MAGHRYVIVSLLLLTTVAHIANAIVCTPGACDTVRCANVAASTCTEDQMFVQNAGYCGCCSACVKKIRKGEICTGSPFLGTPEMKACEEGTTCSKMVGDNLVCD